MREYTIINAFERRREPAADIQESPIFALNFAAPTYACYSPTRLNTWICLENGLIFFRASHAPSPFTSGRPEGVVTSFHLPYRSYARILFSTFVSFAVHTNSTSALLLPGQVVLRHIFLRLFVILSINDVLLRR